MKAGVGSEGMTISIGALDGEAEAVRCATIMSTADPWITLGRGFDKCHALINDPTREVYVAKSDGELAGFLILTMQGAFRGYIQTIAVDEKFRGRGIGDKLMQACIEFTRASERSSIILESNTKQVAAIRLYRKFGFRDTPLDPNSQYVRANIRMELTVD